MGADTAATVLTPAGEPLLVSKFALPLGRVPFVPRRRLLDRLTDGVQGPLTLVSAPAGSGKSLLAATWAGVGPMAGRVVWLTLDVADNDPATFWFYVVEALRHGGVPLADPPGSPVRPGEVSRSFLARLASGLAAQRALVLILDEFEAITDQRVVDGLEFVLQHAAPAMRLVLLTRRDPSLRLQRHRADGTLKEIRAAELAFTVSEAAQLLELHGVSIPRGAVAALQERTEGWAAGLRLAALTLEDHPDAEGFVASFAADDTAIADYLVTEVLQVQTPTARDLLTRASILDRVHPDLANALTQRQDGRATLAGLAQGNAFVEPIDGVPHWYRFHPLLREVLRTRISYESAMLLPELHLRAARWLADDGQVVQAVEHAAAAGDWRYASSLLVDDVAVALPLTSNEGRHLASTLSTMPVDVPGPEPAVVAAAVALAGDDLVANERWLHRARGVAGEAEPDRRPALDFALALVELLAARTRGDVDGVLTAGGQMRDLMSELPATRLGRHPEIQDLMHSAEGASLLRAGRVDDAERVLASGLATAEDRTTDYPRLAMLGELALLEAGRGHLRRAAVLGREALNRASDAGLPAHPVVAASHIALAWVAVEWNDLHVARDHLDRAAEPVEGGRDRMLTATLALVRTRLLRRGGRLDEALATISAARSQGIGRPASGALPAWLRVQLLAAASEVHLARGKAEEALAALRPMDDLGVDRAPALARAWVAIGDSAKARQVLQPLLQPDGAVVASLGALVEGLLVHAQVAAMGGAHATASRGVSRAARLAQPEGLRRPFLDSGPWLRTVLRTDPALSPLNDWLLPPSSRPRRAVVPAQRRGEGSDAPPLLVERLSGREHEVLRYLSQMMSTEEIAAQMFLSRNTVKTHLRNVYRKLSAKRRSEAVRRARQLGLL